MPKAVLHQLSALQVERLQSHGKENLINDGGGLYLFLRENGAKEWVFRYTSPVTNKRRKQSIGSYPDKSLKDARQIASAKRETLSNGIDPILEKEKSIQTEAKNFADRQLKKRSTVRLIFQEWKLSELQNRKDQGKEIERTFNKDVFPTIGDTAIGEVTRDQVKYILSKVVNRKANRMANRLLSDMKQFFGYADDEELIAQDPTRRLFKDRVGGKEKSRKRYLLEEELTLLKQQLPISGLKTEYQHAVWLLLATGCRVNEILQTKWDNIDFVKRCLHIPAQNSKNMSEHNIFLSDFAIEQLKIINKTKYSAWLMPNRSGTGPVSRQALTKQITDRQSNAKVSGRTSNNKVLVMPNGRWVIHDLRRTVGTMMQEIGIMPHIIKKCLNQRTDDRIIETYQRASLREQQKEAFERLGAHLAEIFASAR
jgi:integrase